MPPPPSSCHISHTSLKKTPTYGNDLIQGEFNSWQPRGREMPLSEIMLWATPEGPPRALQTSECRELLNPTRTSCLILAQRQPGKLRNRIKLTFHPIPPHVTSGTLPPPKKEIKKQSIRSRGDCAIYKRINTVYSSPLSLH